MGRAYNTTGEKNNGYRLLVGKQEERKELGRPRCKWVDNIELDIGGNG
jgi:hypothetical protein